MSVTLRYYSDEDHARTLEWLRDSELRRLIGTSAEPTPEGHISWLKRMRARDDVRLYSIYVGHTHVGNLRLADLDPVHRRAEVQLFLAPAEPRGRGLGTAAIEASKREAFDELHLHRLYAYVFGYNERAARAFQRAGFRLEGRLREHRKMDERFIDVLVFGCLRDDG